MKNPHVCRKARHPGRTRTFSQEFWLSVARVRAIIDKLGFRYQDGFDRPFDDCY